MNPGRLNQRLRFERLANPEGQDLSGAPQGPWESVFTVWGKFEPLGGREFPTMAKMHAETQGRFRIRYRKGVGCEEIDVATYRIYWHGKQWNLHTADLTDQSDRTRRFSRVSFTNHTNVELTFEASEVK
jgi:head-tail adaptor